MLAWPVMSLSFTVITVRLAAGPFCLALGRKALRYVHVGKGKVMSLRGRVGVAFSLFLCACTLNSCIGIYPTTINL